MRRVTSQILFVWLISAIISVPPLIGWNDWSFTGTEGPCELSNNKGYVVYSASGSFYIPLVIMSIVYLKIYLATRKRLRERANAAAKVRKRFNGNCRNTTSDSRFDPSAGSSRVGFEEGNSPVLLFDARRHPDGNDTLRSDCRFR